MVAARSWKSVWELLPSPSLAGWPQMSLYQGKQAGIYAETGGVYQASERRAAVLRQLQSQSTVSRPSIRAKFRLVLLAVVEDHVYGPVPDLLGIPSCDSHGSILSKIGASGFNEDSVAPCPSTSPFRRPSAISRASRAGSVRRLLEVCHSALRRETPSATKAMS